MTSKRLLRGQAGVIGGIIIVAILFSIALPLVLQYQRSAQKVVEGSTGKARLMERRMNEILQIQGVPLTQENLLSGLAPGIWVNNTGSVPVSVKRVWLTYRNGTVYAIIDMADPLSSGIIESITINPGTPYARTITTADKGTVPVLQPGDSMHIKLKPIPDMDQLYVYVESGLGVMHPRVGGGQLLAPSTTGGGTSAGGGGGWKGIYAPVSGVKLIGYSDLMASGSIEAWTPPIRLYSASYSWFYGWQPSTFDYSESFIFEDPKYPGLYMIKIKAAGSFYIRYYNYETDTDSYITVSSGEYVCIRGFVGTYDVDYFSGWGFEVDKGPACSVLAITPGTSKRNVTALGVNIYDGALDYDGNGVGELVMFSHLNGPFITRIDTDADSQGGSEPDALVWEYTVARDISNSDFIRITGKVNYYWTTTFSQVTGCPASFRYLKTFSIIIYEYVDGHWVISQYKNYEYVPEKPKQYNFEAVFPVNRTGIYRVGILFYDNYRDFDGEGYTCYTDFTYTLEHLLIEYGVNNPFFTETPAVYILAINGYPTDSIGTYDNVTELAGLVERYLGSLGIPSYVLVDNSQEYEDLLVDNPPKGAIIINLHGSTIPVISGMDISDIHDLIAQNGWIWVSVAGKPAANYSDGTVTIDDSQGLSKLLLGAASIDVNLYDSVNGTANITSVGRYVRSVFLATSLPDTLTMRWQVTVDYNTTYFNETCVFYQNYTGMPFSLAFIDGTTGLGKGAVIINGLDKPQTAQDLDTIAAFATYFSVYVWGILNNQIEDVCASS